MFWDKDLGLFKSDIPTINATYYIHNQKRGWIVEWDKEYTLIVENNLFRQILHFWHHSLAIRVEYIPFLNGPEHRRFVALTWDESCGLCSICRWCLWWDEQGFWGTQANPRETIESNRAQPVLASGIGRILPSGRLGTKIQGISVRLQHTCQEISVPAIMKTTVRWSRAVESLNRREDFYTTAFNMLFGLWKFQCLFDSIVWIYGRAKLKRTACAF